MSPPPPPTRPAQRRPSEDQDPAGDARRVAGQLADFIACEPEVVELPEDGLRLLDCHPTEGDMRAEVLAGLSRTPQRTLPTKYLYDRRGSELFDRITELDAYYPTRTELSIFESRLPEIAAMIGPCAAIVEPGAGSSLKIRRLLDALESPHAYAPVEISRTHVIAAARALAGDYPALRVAPVCADFTGDIALPEALTSAPGRRVVFFPGSTIGNFEAPMRAAILRRFAEIAGPDGLLLLGVDLIKDPGTLQLAYEDPQGVTAAFILNYLDRLNRELDADFDLDHWSLETVVNQRRSRVELNARSARAQAVSIAGETFEFAEGERVHVESSQKFTERAIDEEVAGAGFNRRLGRWTDDRDWFSVVLYERG